MTTTLAFHETASEFPPESVETAALAVAPRHLEPEPLVCLYQPVERLLHVEELGPGRYWVPFTDMGEARNWATRRCHYSVGCSL